MLKPEILAPAGGMDALRAAVGAGADAVYLGMHGFNARRNASNFGEEELKEAARYCHIRGVSLYVTLNIIVGDEEFPALREAAVAGCRAGAVAAIVQELGAAAFLPSHCAAIYWRGATRFGVWLSISVGVGVSLFGLVFLHSKESCLLYTSPSPRDTR